MLLTNATDLGLLIRERRRELDITQSALAAAVGASRQWVGKVENGRPGAEFALVLKALHALQLRVHVLPEGAAAAGGDAADDAVDLDALLGRHRR